MKKRRSGGTMDNHDAVEEKMAVGERNFGGMLRRWGWTDRIVMVWAMTMKMSDTVVGRGVMVMERECAASRGAT